MQREDAAQFLGVSTKTLYRLEQAGKLSSRKVRTERGQISEYDLADLSRLKNERDARAQVPKISRPQPMKRVTFGLPDQDLEALTNEAKQYGLKPGEYARRLMREAMESKLTAEIHDLRAQEKKTASEVKRLRAEVAAAVEALLEYLNFAPEEAKTWVTENLR